LDFSDVVCGGNFTNASGLIMSPSYPNKYPLNADCIYLISRPDGTYLNLSLINMDINCHAAGGSHYIEMRDGDSQDSPLMAKFCGNGSTVPAFLVTIQNHLRIK